MKEGKPGQIAASLRIAIAVRDAMAEAMAQHATDLWDRQVLAHELARLLGVYLRGEGSSPAELDEVVRVLREVFAGLDSGDPMTLVEAIQQYCHAELVSRSGPPLDESDDPPLH